MKMDRKSDGKTAAETVAALRTYGGVFIPYPMFGIVMVGVRYNVLG